MVYPGNSLIAVFTLYCSYTVTLLILFALLVTSKQYYGEPINRWCPAHFESSHVDFTNAVCWVRTERNVIRHPCDYFIKLITDRIGRMGEGNVFSLSTPGGGGTPARSRWGKKVPQGTYPPAKVGIPPGRSGWGLGTQRYLPLWPR